ncbi:type IX secretion system protein PorG [Riemerella columbipharyngis]|uniref:Outer membrane insertion C-terminal signal n=1 Tax=Riemerella columbipharyngis TaxID=1071918 RepID=A0A1G7CIW4_9FLAO|nr:DUF6089 family protein [Riemerella columbipharyngis]SDE38670.1 outer membrane insertion C-terminal signal [Riemerella columbipharyngis]
MRKKNLVSVLCLLGLFLSKAQRHEIGMFAGNINIVGDIGETNYVLQGTTTVKQGTRLGLPITLGILYRMNFNPYQTLRFDLGYSNVKFIDEASDENYRKQRYNSESNTLYNLDAIFEYYFLPVNDEQRAMLSPYIFGGVGALVYNSWNMSLDFRNKNLIDTVGNFVQPSGSDDAYRKPIRESGNNMTLSIPFGVGVKYKFNYNWALFAEVLFRPTFTDEIDYSVISDKNVRVLYDKDEVKRIRGNKNGLSSDEIHQIIQPYIDSYKIGNLKSKDWVNNISVGVSYSFGRPPCYCEK